MCEDSKKVVAASDRMWTAGILSLEFEHTRPKIVDLTDSCVMMTAGPALRDLELKKHVKRELAGASGIAIPMIVEKVKEGYQAARRKKIEEIYFSPRGLTLERYLAEGRSLLSEVAMMLDEHLATYDYEVEVLVAGVDSDGAHIYGVYNPGTVESFDALGHHAIGSGETHAAFALIEGVHTHSATLQETMWAVYEAKKLSERAPGVGQAGDFAIIEQGAIVYFDGETLKSLSGLHEEMIKSRANCLMDIKPKLSGIPLPKKKKRGDSQ